MSIRYKHKESDKWLVEWITKTTSGPLTRWAWSDDINLATDINVGILPPAIREDIKPHNVSIETNITDLGEYK